MIDEETPENPQRSSFQPRQQPTGNLKLKMLTLIGMLLMVAYAMHEAGKPENWEWMNFPKDTPADSELNDSSSPADAISSGSIPPSNASSSNPPGNKTNRSDSASKPIRLTDDSLPTINNQRVGDIPIESSKFWRGLFTSLNSGQQFLLFEILDQLQSPERLSQPSPATDQQKRLIDRINRQRVSFDDQMMDRMTSLPSSSQEKSRASEDYFEADKFWSQNISVSLKAFLENSDITLNQQRQVLRLQNFLVGEALNLVQDNTAIGWSGDSLAWKRSWKMIHAGPPETAKEVTRIQLVAQPNEYRGQHISIQGYVRAIEARTAEVDNSIVPSGGSRDYFILWIKPIESQAGPYCVYTNQIPSDLPTDNQQLKSFDSLATVHGLFFKNRSYPAASGEVLSCPLILASKINLAAAKTAKESSLFWQPGRTAIFVLVWLVPLIAIGGTWLVFRAAGTRKRLPNAVAEQKLGVFLGDLKDDPNVQTDLQKVQAIKERENEIE